MAGRAAAPLPLYPVAVNYLCHARHALDRPYLLAGTGVPDWLRVSDRASRLKEPDLPPPAARPAGVEAELLAGIHQHFKDDREFHQRSSFHALNREVAALLRKRYPDRVEAPRTERLRAVFVGHILVELLLDGVFMEAFPDAIHRYYDSLGQVQPQAVEDYVGTLAPVPPERLGELVQGFQRYQFLRTYVDDGEVALRLGQVCRRAGVAPLPDDFEQVIAPVRKRVHQERAALLPDADW